MNVRRRGEVSLSSFGVQVRVWMWTGAAEVMRAVVVGWLDGLQEEKSCGVFVCSLCSSLLLSVWSEAAEAMPAVVAGWLAREEKS